MPRTFTPTQGDEEPNIFQAASTSPTDDIEKLAGRAEAKWEDEATFLQRLTPEERRRLLGLIPGEKTASTKVEANLPDDVEALRREREEILTSISERKKRNRKVSTKWSVKAAERLADGRRQKQKRKAATSQSPVRDGDLPQSFDLQGVVDSLRAEAVIDADRKRRATGLSDPDQDLADIIGNLQSQVESKDATIHMLNSELVSCRSLVTTTESRAKEALFQILEIIGHPNPPESLDPLVECTFSALHTFLTQLHAEMNELRTQKESAELEKRHAQALNDDALSDNITGESISEGDLRRIVDRQAKKIHYLEDKVALQEEEISRQKAALQAALSTDSRQALASTYPLREKPNKGGDSPIKRLDSELESFRMQLADWKNTDRPFSTGGMVKAARSHAEQLSRQSKAAPASPPKQSNGDFGTGKSSVVDTMGTQTNLRDTMGSIPLNDSVAETTFQSKIRETWYMPVHAKGRYETAVALIRELRRRLNCEKHEHENLKVKYEELQSEYQYAVEVLRDDVGNLRTNEEELVGEVERLLDENTILSTDLRLKSKELNSLKSAAQKEITNTQTLRELYMRSLNAGSRTKKPAWDKFWKELATPEVLETSKPPGMFPVEELNAATKAEYKKLLEDSKVHENEMRKILEERDTLVVERDELVKWKTHETRKIDRKFRLQEQHLVGAMRRIKFLVEEREKCEKSCTFKDKYILKLESQILKLEAALRKARQTNSAFGSGLSGGNQSGIQGSFSYWDATAKLSGQDSPTRTRRSKLDSVLGADGGINEEGDEEVVDVLNESMQSMTRAEYNMFLRSTDEVSQSLMLGTSALNDDEDNGGKGDGNWPRDLYNMAFDDSTNLAGGVTQGTEGGPSSTLNLSLSASRASNLLDGSLEPRKEALEQEAKRQGVMKKTKQQQQQRSVQAAVGEKRQEGARTIVSRQGAAVGSKRLAWSPGPGVAGYATQKLVATSSQHEKRTREVQRVAKRSASTPPTQERQGKLLASTTPAQSQQRVTPSKQKATPNQSRALTPQERGTPITVSASERHLPGQEPPSRAAQRHVQRGETPSSSRNNLSARTPGSAANANEPSMEMASSAHNPRYRRGFIGEQEQRVLSFEEELDMFLEQED